MTRRPRAVSLIACRFLLPVVLAVCSGKEQQAKIPPVPVQVGKVQHVQERAAIAVSGTVASPDSPSNVSFLVSGKVMFVGPREGDFVDKGQRLASVDATDYELTLASAKAQADRAKVEYERADDEHRRMKMLYDSHSLAPNDYQKYKAAFDSARQQYDEAVASEKLSRKRLSDALLAAPVSGFISKRSIEVGDSASTGHPVFEIVQMDPVDVNVGIPETDVGLVRIGQQVDIKVPALPGKSFKGTVRVLNVSADPGTRTYTAKSSVPNPEHTLRVGMVAEATILGDQVITKAIVPGDAVVRDPQGATQVFVYYPEKKRVYAKRVDVGGAVNREIEIRSGLSGDEWIVLAGQWKLRDGMEVSASESQTGSK